MSTPSDRTTDDKPLVNRVAASGLITLKPEELVKVPPAAAFDLAPHLWQGLALREKEFRQSLRDIDWSKYDGLVLCVFCTTDAIIPPWAFMLVAAHARDHAAGIFVGSPADHRAQVFAKAIEDLDVEVYRDQRLVVKGCSDGEAVPPAAYAQLLWRLAPVAASVMYGEPCSTVPVYKRPKQRVTE